MKIKKTELNKIIFSELKEGEVFQFGDTLFMVIEEVEDSSYNSHNAVTLKEGELNYFHETEEVIKIEGYFKQE